MGVRVLRLPFLVRMVGTVTGPNVRARVRDRSGGFCEARLPGCEGRAMHVHHRKLRRHGDERVEALLDVCFRCHDLIHKIGGEAYKRGLLVRSYDDPAMVPVVAGDENVHQHDESEIVPGEVCWTCGRRVPLPREDRTPRQRSQLNISVPKDAEDGAEVLRTLISECRKRLAARLAYDADVPPYYVLAAVLSDWLGGN